MCNECPRSMGQGIKIKRYKKMNFYKNNGKYIIYLYNKYI